MARRLPDTPAGPRTRPQPRLTPPGLVTELDAVTARWAVDGAHSEQTLARMTETARRFAARLQAVGASSFAEVTPLQARGFVTAVTGSGTAPEVATQHARRTAVRTLYRTLRTLGQAFGDPTLDVTLPARGLLTARPLTDDEVTLCRASAQLTNGPWASARAVAWALGEATAVSSEITILTVADLDDPHRPRRVRLPGTRRHDPRTGTLTAWGARMVASRAEHLLGTGAGRGALLAYGGAAPPGGAKAQASICNALRDVLNAAGLSAEPDVRPSSLRHWVGRTTYDNGTPIQDVARLLGHRSLDAAAEDIALTWRQTTPAPHPSQQHDLTRKDRA